MLFSDVRIPARHRFTGEDVLRMAASGVLKPDERVELIDGEVLTMPAEGPLHVDTKSELIFQIARALPADHRIGPDTTFRLAEHDWPEPDLYVCPPGMRPSQVRGPDALLVVEVADSTLNYDLIRKAQLYARHGVREYWVVDVNRRRTHIHREPDGDLWRRIRIKEADELLKPLLIPDITLCLADLEWGDAA